MAKKDANEQTELQTTPVAGSGIMALSADGANEMANIISENFGGNQLTLADLDKMKIPSGQGAAVWSIPVLEGDDETTKELRGVIIGWADKKSWWQKSFSESGGKEQPDCKSNDMVHGLGDPNKHFNDKEQQLMDTNKAGHTVRDTEGWLCSTCVHNQFGTAPNGGGKACQDKRFVIFLLQDSVIPVLIRVPATSINNFKQYFKRLTGQRKSYLSVITKLTLSKVDGKIAYYTVNPNADGFLSAEETALVRKLREPFQAALDAEDAIEAGYTEKNVTEETLADMPTHSGTDEDAEAAAIQAEANGDPF